MRALAWVALGTMAAAMAACSGGGGGAGGDDDDDGGPTPTPTPTASASPTPLGSSSGTLKVVATAQHLIAQSPIAEQYSVYVEDPAGPDVVEDATVTFGPEGAPHTIPYGGATYDYGVNNTAGLPTVYALDVERGSDFLTGVVFDAHSTNTVTLDPSPPDVSTALDVTWSPSGEAGVTVQVDVHREFALVYSHPETADSGAVTIPGSAFTTAGFYSVSVQRKKTLPLASPDSTVTLNLFWTRGYTVD